MSDWLIGVILILSAYVITYAPLLVLALVISATYLWSTSDD